MTRLNSAGNSLGKDFLFSFFLRKKFLIFIFGRERERERERERQSASGGGEEREGDTESEAGSRLQAVSTKPDAGLEPRDHDLSRSRTFNQLSHAGAPGKDFYDPNLEPKQQKPNGPEEASTIDAYW